MKERSTKQRKANLFGRPKLPHVFGLKYDEKLAFSFVKCRLEYSQLHGKINTEKGQLRLSERQHQLVNSWNKIPFAAT